MNVVSAACDCFCYPFVSCRNYLVGCFRQWRTDSVYSDAYMILARGEQRSHVTVNAYEDAVISVVNNVEGCSRVGGIYIEDEILSKDPRKYSAEELIGAPFLIEYILMAHHDEPDYMLQRHPSQLGTRSELYEIKAFPQLVFKLRSDPLKGGEHQWLANVVKEKKLHHVIVPGIAEVMLNNKHYYVETRIHCASSAWDFMRMVLTDFRSEHQIFLPAVRDLASLICSIKLPDLRKIGDNYPPCVIESQSGEKEYKIALLDIEGLECRESVDPEICRRSAEFIVNGYPWFVDEVVDVVSRYGVIDCSQEEFHSKCRNTARISMLYYQKVLDYMEFKRGFGFDRMGQSLEDIINEPINFELRHLCDNRYLLNRVEISFEDSWDYWLFTRFVEALNIEKVKPGFFTIHQAYYCIPCFPLRSACEEVRCILCDAKFNDRSMYDLITNCSSAKPANIAKERAKIYCALLARVGLLYRSEEWQDTTFFV